MWAGGEEPAQQLCVSPASVPSGSAALTHPNLTWGIHADRPPLPGAGLAHGCHCEHSQSRTRTPRVPWVKSLRILQNFNLGKMPVGFPALPQRGSEVPLGQGLCWESCAPTLGFPPRPAPGHQCRNGAGRREEAGVGKGPAALSKVRAPSPGRSCVLPPAVPHLRSGGTPRVRHMLRPSLCWWLSQLL